MIRTSIPKVRYDHIIIGTGPSASSYAHVLGSANPQEKILMLERGPNYVNDDIFHVKNPLKAWKMGNEMLRDYGHFIRAGNALGGGTAVNHLAWVPPCIEDFQACFPSSFHVKAQE